MDLSSTEELVFLSGNSELHQAMALYVKLGWIFLLRVAFLSVIGDYFLCDEKQSSGFVANQ